MEAEDEYLANQECKARFHNLKPADRLQREDHVSTLGNVTRENQNKRPLSLFFLLQGLRGSRQRSQDPNAHRKRRTAR